MTIEDLSSWPALVGSSTSFAPRTEISCGESDDPNNNPEWEMLVDDDDDDIVNVDQQVATTITSSIIDYASFIFPDVANETIGMNTTATTPIPLAFVRHNTGDSNNSNRVVEGQRPRSYTVGGGGDEIKAATNTTFFHRAASGPIRGFMTTVGASLFPKRRTSLLRKCSSTPDLLICDDDHDIVIDDISDDSEDEETSEEEDAELVEHGGGDYNNNESFEVLSTKAMNEEEEDEFTKVGVEEDDDYSEIAPPSINTSSCWSLTSTLLPHPSSAASVAWGSTASGPTFKEVLLARQRINSSDEGEFGKDKAMTEAKLLDPNRRNHHLRIRIKPKLVVVDDDGSISPGTKTMKHAHSTGDLSKMLHVVGEGHESSFGQGRRRVKKKQMRLTIMEEDDNCDFVIGRGSGGGIADGGGGGTVIGDTDAIDYYQRKEHGSKSTVNKKKERPDEAKRREIIMYKKGMQRLKQAESLKGQQVESSSTKEMKKTKNDKGVRGKKDKRR